LGDESGAQASLDRALQLSVDGQRDPADVAALWSSIATLKRARGDLPAAEADFRQALAVVQRALPADHPQVGQVLRNLASLETATGRYAEAQADYEEALRILEPALPGHPDVAATLVGLGNALKARGQTALAREKYRQAIRIHREALGPDAVALALDYYDLAVLALEAGDLHAALDTATVAEELSQRHFRLVARGVSEREALRYSAGRVRGTDIVLTCAARSDSVADWQRAWDLVIRSRAVVLEEIADRRRLLSTTAEPGIARLDSQLTAATNHLAHLVVRGRGKLSQQDYLHLLQSAERDKEAAERVLASHSESFRLRQARQEVGFRDVAAALPLKSALIAWVRFERLERVIPAGGAAAAADSDRTAYGAFVLSGSPQQVRFVVLGSGEEIDAKIADWHREAGGGPRSHGRQAAHDAYCEAGRALRKAVWDPVAAGLENAERIFLVPDGALALLNFYTLPDDGVGYLIEKVPLLQLLSTERDLIQSPLAPTHGTGLLTAAAPDYQELPAASRQALPAAAEPSLTRGNPCGQFKTLWFDSLPGARAEELKVARLWRKYGAKLDAAHPGGDQPPKIIELVGAAATEEALRRLAPGCNTLHIATHGFFLGAECLGRRANAGAATPDELSLGEVMTESPLLLSGLAFSGSNLRDRARSSNEDGILTAEEIAAMNLAGVDWVVLSACQTGLGKVEAGEGVFGMRRAFQVAGVRSVVMTLWAVDDAATAQWIETLFEHRLHRGQTVAEAVRSSSLDMLRQRRDAGLDSHPYYWGAFVSTGDWR
jgi:CHAT domain-containing protein